MPRVFICLFSFASVFFCASLAAAAEVTRGIEIRPKPVLVNLRGSATASQGRKLGFRDTVEYGERIRTGPNTSAGILVDGKVLLMMLSDSEAELSEESQAQVIKLFRGTIRLAVSGQKLAGDQSIIVQTPTARAVTRGALAQVELAQATAKRASLGLGGVNIVRVAAVSGQAADVEKFNVFEGSLQLTTPGNPSVTLGPGQGVEVADGRPGQPFSGSAATGFVPELVANEGHAQSPQALVQNLSANQMSQAQALATAIVGGQGPEASQAGANEDQIILATANLTTPQQSLFGQGSNPFNSQLGAINTSASAFLDDSNDAQSDIPITTLFDARLLNFTPQGGSGLLLFTENALTSTKSTVRATTELVLVDGGLPGGAPHGGVAPNSPLVVLGLSNQTNQKLKLQDAASEGGEENSNLLKQTAVVATVKQVNYRFSIIDHDQNDAIIKITANLSDVDDISSQGQPPNTSAKIFDVGSNGAPTNLSLFSSQQDGAVALDPLTLGGNSSFGNLESFIDAQIRARSDSAPNLPVFDSNFPSNDRTITLSGGAVLDQGTQLTVGDTQATLNAGTDLNGSVIALVANAGDPAFVRAEDSLLTVLNGSSIAPEVGKNIALLFIKDSQLVGPTNPTTLTDAGGNPARTDENGAPAISPIIEVRDSPNSVTVHNAVAVHSTEIVPAVVAASPADSTGAKVDAALLQASSQIMQIVNSNLTTTAHFANFVGSGTPETLLQANLKNLNDALVVLNNANLTLNGDAFRFTNGAGADVTGNFVSLTNGSKLKIGDLLKPGAFLHVGPNSTVALKGSFALFGAGNNQIVVTNNFCNPCTQSIGSLPVAGNGTLNIAKGFTPFLSTDGKSVNADGSGRVIFGTTNSAFLKVDGTLNLDPRK